MRKNSLALIMLLFAVCCTVFVSSAYAHDPHAKWAAEGSRGDVLLYAKYTEEYEDDGVSYAQKLKVEVNGAPANTRMTVSIGNTQIGILITDADGYGTLSKSKFGVPDDGTGRPAGPRINTGDMITISKGKVSLDAEFLPIG